MNNVLGYMPCGCGKRAQVMQTKRKGAHLYTRCDDCGLDQRTGARVQKRIWESAEWIDGAPTPPENIDITEKPTKRQPKEGPDFDPTKTEKKPKNDDAKEGGGGGKWLLGLGGLGLVVGAVLAGIKGGPK